MTLSPRLAAVAGLVRQGSRFCDVGTDHGCLPVWLVSQGICPGGIAADLRAGPLSRAAETVKRAGLSEKITLCLSDGLDQIPSGSAEDIIMAGMGGMTMLRIIERAAWLCDRSIRLILQPQSCQPELRRFLADKGFAVEAECAVREGRHCYDLFSLSYTGKRRTLTPVEAVVGLLPQNRDEDSVCYVKMQLRRVKRRYDGLSRSGRDAAETKELLLALEHCLEEMT